MTTIAIQGDFAKMLTLSAQIRKPWQILRSPYWAGMDAANNGADMINAHFCWFGSSESTKSWNRGFADRANGRLPFGYAGIPHNG